MARRSSGSRVRGRLRSTSLTLRERRRNFQELLGNVNLVAITLDRSARLTYCNAYLLQLTGWTSEEIIGENWFGKFIPPEETNLKETFADLITGQPASWFHENEILTRSGERRIIRWNNTVLRNATGRVVGTASIGEDVTEHRLLERALLDANGREHRKLGSELHDGLGQHLFGVALLAQTLSASAQKLEIPIAEDLRQLASVANEALESCRRVARGLSPLADVQGGLIQALRQLTALPGVSDTTKVTFAANEVAPLRLSAEAQDHLYRLAQEGMTNALKHSGARSIILKLDIQSTRVRLILSDDGVGIPVGAAESARLGLKIMRYRANLIAATLSIQSDRGHGTRVVVELRQPVTASP